MVTLDPELVDVIRNAKGERIGGSFDQFHGRKPAFECVGTYLRFERKGQFLPQLSALLVHNLLTALQNCHKGRSPVKMVTQRRAFQGWRLIKTSELPARKQAQTHKIRGEKRLARNKCWQLPNRLGMFLRGCLGKGECVTHYRAAEFLETIHILFTSLPVSPCQRLEIRNRRKLRQEKI
jgi:hypothetical protein